MAAPVDWNVEMHLPGQRRGRLQSAVLIVVLTGGLLTGAPARADGPIEPGLVDPAIGALMPMPAPHVPYRGDLCRSGRPQCIDVTLTEMRRRLKPLARTCQHDAVFALAYLRVTEDVKRALKQGHFLDTVWLQQVDKVFAHLYFDTMDQWHDGRRGAVPEAWRIALRAEDAHAMTGIGNFLLAMNAHINRDFPHVLATAGLTAKNGRSHKRDHNAYNSRLDGLYHPVFAEEAQRFDPSFDDVDAGPIDEVVVGTIMRGWRELVWRHAEMLVMAPSPALRILVEREIEEYAAGQARMIRQMFASPSSAARDAFCARARS
ncbi:MAG: DUF5995 family protein [Nocardioides sp.]